MVFVADLPWLQRVTAGLASPGGREEGWERSAGASREAHGALAEWPAFNMADAMEQGLARGVTTRFTEATFSGVQREFVVCRSDDMLEYTLIDASERPWLFAKACEEKKRVDIFIAGDDADSVESTPAFELVYSEDTLYWELRAFDCEKCAYQRPIPSLHDKGTHAPLGARTLLRVFQESTPIGECRAMCMDVDVPSSASDWCPCCCRQKGPGKLTEPIRFLSRRPRWSRSRKSLTMSFVGRCHKASAKNFQLLRETERGEMSMSFGKMGPGLFCLDFKPPFGAVQAFATALSTMHWI